MSRGVYVNGSVHYFGMSIFGGTDAHPENNYCVYHSEFIPDSNTWILPYTPYAPYSPDLSDNNTLTSYIFNPVQSSAMNGAVFDQKVFFAFTGHLDTDVNTGGYTHVYVAAWDLTSSAINKFRKGADGNYIKVIDLGSTSHSNKVDSKGNPTDVAGAAIVVFNNLLYVFSDNGTYTSADGVNWSSYPMSPNNNVDWEPLDAITYYPQDADPKITIIYGTSASGHYTNIWAANWNGQFGTASDFNSERLDVGNHNYLDAGVALFAGTVTPFGPRPDNNGAPYFKAGAKQSSLQLFLGGNSAPQWPQNDIIRMEYTYSKTGGKWAAVDWFSMNYGFDYFVAFPWYTTECSGHGNDNGSNIQRQQLAINYFDWDKNYKMSNDRSVSFTSDAMVPLNTDGVPVNCDNPGGISNLTSTDSSLSPDEMATLRKYWTLVGVILGSPPFGVNHAVDYDVQDLSNVYLGQEGSQSESFSQETENSVLLSAGLEIRTGIKDIFGYQNQADFGFKHAWQNANEKTSTSGVGFSPSFGTGDTSQDDLDNLGTSGWAIFSNPTIIVQDYALYAYDYDSNNPSSGTYLNQDIHTTYVNKKSTIYQVPFNLEDPAESSLIPGLMSGMQPFYKSTDLYDWSQVVWEAGDGSGSNVYYQSDYEIVLGSGARGEDSLNLLNYAYGTNTEDSAIQKTETLDSTKQTTSVDVTDGMTFSFGTELKGFKVDLKAGYDGQFSQGFTTTTSLDQDVKLSLKMKDCSDSDCITSLSVQPYFLRATDPNAPWIPDAYKSQLPWAIAWKVMSFETADGKRLSQSPLPNQGTGEVVGGAGGESSLSAAEASRGSGYSLKGGKMEWQEKDGNITPIPMTALDFVPALGANVRLNGYAWSSLQTSGNWTRQGNVWIYTTSETMDRDLVVLKLDFGKRTWDFDLSKSDLSHFIKPLDARMHLELVVNGKFGFFYDCQHNIESQWDMDIPATATDKYELSRYSGAFDASTGIGNVVLEGTLPSSLQHFGDMSFAVNGYQIDVPLISQQNYGMALASGSALVNEKDDVKLSVDFGKKIWSIQIEGRAFNPLHAPRGKEVMINVKVGGQTMYSGKHTIQNYASTFSFHPRGGGPRPDPR